MNVFPIKTVNKFDAGFKNKTIVHRESCSSVEQTDNYLRSKVRFCKLIRTLNEIKKDCACRTV